MPRVIKSLKNSAVSGGGGCEENWLWWQYDVPAMIKSDQLALPTPFHDTHFSIPAQISQNMPGRYSVHIPLWS